MFRFFRFLAKAKSTRLFTRTPAHKSSEALKIEAVNKLDGAVTHAEFRMVLGLIERIIVRFEEDERIEMREAQAAARKPHQNQNPQNQHPQNQHKGHRPDNGHPNGPKKFGNH